jgi:hypothetical protein
LRIVLLTLESPLSDAAVADVLGGSLGDRIVLLGRSALRPPTRGGWPSLASSLLRRSGPRLLPYLAINYGGGPRRLSRLAAERGIPAPVLTDMNGPVALAMLREARPDLIVTLHCDQILAPATLAMARFGGVNLHPSLLPLHRGPVPTIWALAEHQPRFGVTVHRLVQRIDAGPVLAQEAIALPATITASAAARRLHRAGVPLLARAIRSIEMGCGGRSDPALPYCPLPPPALLRGLARRGRRLVDAHDAAVALGAEPAEPAPRRLAPAI